MYNIGKVQLIEVVGKAMNGFYIKAHGSEEAILLPTGECIGEVEVHESVNVFIYRDTEDRLIATMKSPLASVGDLAYLKVVDVVEFGAFINIGLQRDVFVPLQENASTLEVKKSYLFRLYVDKSERLCASPKVYDYLTVDHEYKANDEVKATVIRISPEIGAFVAVDNKYKGMIPNSEHFENLELGQILDLRVIRVREDNKLDCSTRRLVADQIDVDAEKIYSRLLSEGGKLHYHDKSSPEAIKAEFEMSKKAFKRALGRLMKDDKIEMYEEFIEKKGE